MKIAHCTIAYARIHILWNVVPSLVDDWAVELGNNGLEFASSAENPPEDCIPVSSNWTPALATLVYWCLTRFGELDDSQSVLAMRKIAEREHQANTDFSEEFSMPHCVLNESLPSVVAWWIKLTTPIGGPSTRHARTDKIAVVVSPSGKIKDHLDVTQLLLSLASETTPEATTIEAFVESIKKHVSGLISVQMSTREE